jgi:hypothetical protein
MNLLKTRAWAAAATCALLADVVGGCSAGQQSQTAAMQPAVNGNMANVNDVALRNVRIRAEETGYAVPPGKEVHLVLVATNQSRVTADTVVAITSGIGKVALGGNTEIPAGGKLFVDSPDRAHPGALASVDAVNAATATVTLSKPAFHGMTYDFTFEFAHAGAATVGVPIVPADSNVSATSQVAVGNDQK